MYTAKTWLGIEKNIQLVCRLCTTSTLVESSTSRIVSTTSLTSHEVKLVQTVKLTGVY